MTDDMVMFEHAYILICRCTTYHGIPASCDVDGFIVLIPTTCVVILLYFSLDIGHAQALGSAISSHLSPVRRNVCMMGQNNRRRPSVTSQWMRYRPISPEECLAAT